MEAKHRFSSGRGILGKLTEEKKNIIRDLVKEVIPSAKINNQTSSD